MNGRWTDIGAIGRSVWKDFDTEYKNFNFCNKCFKLFKITLEAGKIRQKTNTVLVFYNFSRITTNFMLF